MAMLRPMKKWRFAAKVAAITPSWSRCMQATALTVDGGFYVWNPEAGYSVYSICYKYDI